MPQPVSLGFQIEIPHGSNWPTMNFHSKVQCLHLQSRRVRLPLGGVVGQRIPTHSTAQASPSGCTGEGALLLCLRSVPRQKAGNRIPPVRSVLLQS